MNREEKEFLDENNIFIHPHIVNKYHNHKKDKNANTQHSKK